MLVFLFLSWAYIWLSIGFYHTFRILCKLFQERSILRKNGMDEHFIPCYNEFTQHKSLRTLPFRRRQMRLIDSLINHLSDKGYISTDEKDLFRYGFDITFYTLWSTLLLLLIAYALGQFWSGIIIVFMFYTFQSYGGGYHADTHLKCLSFMIAGLLFGLSFVLISGATFVLSLLIVISTFVLLLFPLVLHPNRSYLESEKDYLIKRSRIVTVFCFFLTLVINSFFDKFLYAFSAVFFLAAISRICGKVSYIRKQNSCSDFIHSDHLET